MKRREFIALVGGTTAAWPFAARAQRSSPPVIGFLSGRSFSESRSLVVAFGNGLREAGIVEGQNASIEFKWADGQYDHLPGQAAELVRRPVALIAAVGAVPAIRAAKAAPAPRNDRGYRSCPASSQNTSPLLASVSSQRNRLSG